MTELLSVEQLKPCPFCGGKSQVVEAFPLFDYPWMIDVDHTQDCPVRGVDQICYDTAAEAVARWNTRAALPPTQGVVEALREALKPFAQVLIDVGDSPQDPDSEDAFGHLADHPLTVGELRRARDAYQASLPLASIGEEVA